MANVLQFVPFVSSLEAGFWHELSQRKLEKYQLSEAVKDIHGYYTNSDMPGLPTQLVLEYSAFHDEVTAPHSGVPVLGQILNTNTLDSFKTVDKKKLLEETAQKIWDDINSSGDVSNPSFLNRFFLLTFADLKKYNFFYWFMFPALMPENPFTYESIESIGKAWSEEMVSSLGGAYSQFKTQHPGVGYFLLSGLQEGSAIQVHPLDNYGSSVEPTDGKLTVGFSDPSTMETNPGWPLRNFIMLIAQKWGDRVKKLDVLCFRDYTRAGQRVISHSLVVKGVELPKKMDPKTLPKVVGWEKNEKGKLAPKTVNLSASMDPVKLATSAVDLNLKLMRWRIMPSLDLSVISDTKCLLLGAGTLGCNVARCLLGWGIKNITFVDNSNVSYSNPVRQSLFLFKDCQDGGKHKAMAAAENLKLIFPEVDAQGVHLNIQMPGHSLGTDAKSVETMRKDVEKLEELVKSHDAVFLLMDTRESRWLPTLLCQAHSRICVNAALGFDTFMVMRHGYRKPSEVPDGRTPSSEHVPMIPGNELGCYFCSDVVAPSDSTRDRTLDQQCTVSRPGISMIAGALAAELLICVLQHPLKGLAPSEGSDDVNSDRDTVCHLGLVPHQIRGFLSRFQNVLPACRSFDKCTACSDIVLTEYRENGFEFLLKVFESPDHLEKLTGLTELYASTLDDQVWEMSDDD